MKSLSRRLLIVRWTARISGSLILAFILFMLAANVFGQDQSGGGLNTTRDIITFICFPISTVIGLSLALKWEGTGGLITIFGMIGLILLRPDLLTAILVLVPIVPGFLYALYWAYNRDLNRTESVV